MPFLYLLTFDTVIFDHIALMNQKYNKNLLLKTFLILVHLVGGIDVSEGNVLAYNPANGMYGPVCDDMWNLDDVTNFIMLVLTIFLFIT